MIPKRSRNDRKLGWKRFQNLAERFFCWFSSRGSVGALPPAVQNFEKWHPLENVECFSHSILWFSSRGLAGVLPPAGQICEKWHPRENVERFPDFCFVIFKQGASRDAASGGSDFPKRRLPLEFCQFPDLFITFKQGFSRGAASGGSDFRKMTSPEEFDDFLITPPWELY